MDHPGNIRYISHADIDMMKWEECLVQSANAQAYAQSFYLDTLAVNWDALVLNDYEAVMPLPNRKKWGFQYLFQPFLTPVLGVFGDMLTEEIVGRFLDAIPPVFKLWDISLNPGNTANQRFQEQFRRNNYKLSLTPAYEILSRNYSENLIRNLAKAQKNNFRVQKGIPVQTIIAICQEEFPHFTKVERGIFEKVKTVLEHYKDLVVTYGVNDADGKLLASCAFLFYKQRAYYWLVGNVKENRTAGASHLLIDHFIRDHAGSNMTLDFEGSDQPSIAGFYRQFGATAEHYTTIYRQQLPTPFKWLKRTPLNYRQLRAINAKS